MIKDKKFLPVGTIVRINNSDNMLMITGFLISNKNVCYDYCGCVYPEGILQSEIKLLFNHDEIDDIVYLGFLTDEYRLFNNKLIELENKNNIKISEDDLEII